MHDLSSQGRITADPAICGGRPTIRGTRIRVSDILEMLASGADRRQILADFDYLGDEDITAALGYAAAAIDRRVIRGLMVRFLVDAEFPPALADRLKEAGHDADHVHRLDPGAAPDRVIWNRACLLKATLVTKDVDFLSLSKESPPLATIVWISWGNVTNAALGHPSKKSCPKSSKPRRPMNALSRFAETHAAPPACVFRNASPQAFARVRTRKM